MDIRTPRSLEAEAFPVIKIPERKRRDLRLSLNPPVGSREWEELANEALPRRMPDTDGRIWEEGARRIRQRPGCN